MTSQEDTPTQIYIPALHREIVSKLLPETVLFLNPGLPQTAMAPGFFHPQTYPFSMGQAACILDELLAMGEALDLSTPTGKDSARATQPQTDNTEKADIARFAAALPPEQVTEADPKIAAQKVLLLAWDLENRLLEITNLRREITEAIKPLQENLHGETVDPTRQELARFTPGTLPENLVDLQDIPEPNWRLTVAAIAAFIPKNSLLITCHPGIRAAMLEGGMLHPLPEDVAQKLTEWPEALRSRLLWAQTPLWRVLGHLREPENAPWLLAAPEIIICPAE